MTERLLTARELADVLGLKPGTVLDKYERGEIPGFKWGGPSSPVRFDLDEVLASGRRPGAGGEESPTPRKRPANGVVSQLSPTAIQGGEDG
jgi:hypothetical protein